MSVSAPQLLFVALPMLLAYWIAWSADRASQPPTWTLEARGDGLAIHDGHGRTETISWRDLRWVALHGPGALQPVQSIAVRYAHSTRSRRVFVRDNADGRKLLRAAELVFAWRAAELLPPDPLDAVPDAALSRARLAAEGADAALSLTHDEPPI